jgi:hypothetical protein
MTETAGAASVTPPNQQKIAQVRSHYIKFMLCLPIHKLLFYFLSAYIIL